ncbi:hypothetical protein LCGC14_2873730, partial [marine sediment metagenome]
YQGGAENAAMYDNPVFTELFNTALLTVDLVAQKAIMEELFIIALDDVPYIPIGLVKWKVYWWPWVKNYYGESESLGVLPPVQFMWLDQDLKAEMGY